MDYRYNVPRGVKVISIFYFIVGLFSLLMFLFVDKIPDPAVSSYSGTGFVVYSVIFGLIFLGLGFGLWKGNNIARWVVVILGVLGIIAGILGAIQGTGLGILALHVINIVINLGIVLYLVLGRKARVFFS